MCEFLYTFLYIYMTRSTHQVLVSMLTHRWSALQHENLACVTCTLPHIGATHLSLRHQLCETPISFDQLIIGPLLLNVTILHVQDMICPADKLQLVGNQYAGLPP